MTPNRRPLEGRWRCKMLLKYRSWIQIRDRMHILDVFSLIVPLPFLSILPHSLPLFTQTSFFLLYYDQNKNTSPGYFKIQTLKACATYGGDPASTCSRLLVHISVVRELWNWWWNGCWHKETDETKEEKGKESTPLLSKVSYHVSRSSSVLNTHILPRHKEAEQMKGRKRAAQ